MANLLEAIEIKRKMFFEHEGAPYHCLEVEVSKPTARGGQTLVRIKMRNLVTRAVFDKTFKAGDRFQEPDLEMIGASFLYSDGEGYHFMDQGSYETVTLRTDLLGDDRLLLSDNVQVQIQKFNGNPIGIQLPQHVALTVAQTEPAVRGDTASGGVTKNATLDTGLEIKVPLFIKEGEKVEVNNGLARQPQSSIKATLVLPAAGGPLGSYETPRGTADTNLRARERAHRLRGNAVDRRTNHDVPVVDNQRPYKFAVRVLSVSCLQLIEIQPNHDNEEPSSRWIGCYHRKARPAFTFQNEIPESSTSVNTSPSPMLFRSKTSASLPRVA